MKKGIKITTILFLSILCVKLQSPISIFSADVDGIEIIEIPHFIKVSLGDQLNTEGLVVKSKKTNELINIDKLIFLNYKTDDLGGQTVNVGYESSNASFDIFVTNEHVTNYLPTIKQVFISEISILMNEINIELFNGTDNDIGLDNYSLLVNEEVIDLSLKTIKSKEVIILSYNYHFQQAIEKFNSISFLENNKSVDTFNKQMVYDLSGADEGVFVRNQHIFSPNKEGDKSEWIYVKDKTSNLGKHIFIPAFIDVPNQAKAFARYVMFGIGMLAAGRVEEAFLSLQEEYFLMSIESQEYFSINTAVKVTGINEHGISESVTFHEAHKRIGLLASKSGNKSFVLLPYKKTEINNNFLFIGGLSFSLVGLYVVSTFLLKKKNKNKY